MRLGDCEKTVESFVFAAFNIVVNIVLSVSDIAFYVASSPFVLIFIRSPCFCNGLVCAFGDVCLSVD